MYIQLLLVAALSSTTYANLFFGCASEPSLCASHESCRDDGLLGQCLPDDIPVNDVTSLMDDDKLQLLNDELERLAATGYGWRHPITQCSVAYYMFTLRYDIEHDTEYCNTARPDNIWAMLQTIQGLGEEMIPNESPELDMEPLVMVDNDDEPMMVMNEDDIGRAGMLNDVVERMLDVDQQPSDDVDEEVLEMTAPIDEQQEGADQDGDEYVIVPENELEEEALAMLQNEEDSLVEQPKMEEKKGAPKEYILTKDEENLLKELMSAQVRGDDMSVQLAQLPDDLLDKFITYTETMKMMLVDRDAMPEDEEVVSEDETNSADGALSKRLEEAPSSTMVDDDVPAMLMKKDDEMVGDIELGIDNVPHKIVKGDLSSKKGPEVIHRIEGDRVYVKMDNFVFADDDEPSMMLKAFLEKKIAQPRNVTFVDFRGDGTEFSFRVVPLHSAVNLEETMAGLAITPIDGHVKRNLATSEDIAGAVWNNRNDMMKVSGGGHVEETAVGGIFDHIRIFPLDDTLRLPIIGIAMAVALVSVIAGTAYAYRNRSRARELVKRLAHDIEAKPAKTYEELCRQRMGSRGDGSAATTSKRLLSHTESPTNRHGSTSSWSEDALSASSMDISTGHMILAYMEEHLANKEKLSEDWTQLAAYLPDVIETHVARSSENEAKNRDMNVLPYDHNRVHLKQLLDVDDERGYVNASPISDASPSTPDYIVTQAPLLTTTADFWQMVWEGGSVVIVNITRVNENGDAKCHRYWPNNGSEVNGVFEVHLVSEHMWCEDYVVRSFYLKNLRTLETRTVTQFHYVNWPDNGVPATTASLLEFRRKVNKSYRGKASPIVVHCNSGGGRSGTYCLLDMVLKRIGKGIKQLDVAASLEHIRDQRMALVANQAQYEFVLSCVADETHAILKALPAQH